MLVKVFISETATGAMAPPSLYLLDLETLGTPDHPYGLGWKLVRTIPSDHHSIVARYKIRVALELQGFYIREADSIGLIP